MKTSEFSQRAVCTAGSLSGLGTLPCLLTVMAFAVAMTVRHAQAATLLNEQFNYTTGSLDTQSGATWDKRGSGADATVLSGSLSYPGYGPSAFNMVQESGTSTDDKAALSSSIGSGDIWFSFLVRVTADLGGGKDIFSLGASSGSDGIMVSLADGVNNYGFGVRTKGGTAATFEAGTPRALNTTYLVVGHYGFVGNVDADDICQLWVNPSLGGTPPSPTLTDTGTDFGSTYTQAFVLGGSTAVQFDELHVGTTWQDVAAVPESSSAVLAGVGALLVIFRLSARQRRSVVTR